MTHQKGRTIASTRNSNSRFGIGATVHTRGYNNDSGGSGCGGGGASSCQMGTGGNKCIGTPKGGGAGCGTVNKSKRKDLFNKTNV